ncbi:GTP-binding protein [Roseobacter sp. N2S]|uniref:CobW family GTP-binding protein n=1 Tax=Roseobacter sp. N2S TaxID=2663844 RepID=UPI002865D443|nr:GTP-binding protein [Roseobacter sp. N2S]MDR6263896.1 G3E family GTPase [Roseobacter sp. N2S]
MSPPLPVTVVGGYLGAGKTSLVNHLLRNANGVRLAVLVNEFGALPIDEDLILAQEGDVISIAGGCVCCSYGSDMAAALADLRKLDPSPDHVVLEASGVALPGAIAGSIGLMQGFSMDGVVILADAETLRANADHKYMGDTVTRQLADADIVVLNKADLVDASTLASSRAFAQNHAIGAQIIQAEHGALPPEILLQTFVGRSRDGALRHDTSGFGSVSLPFEMPCDPTALAQLLASDQLDLVRAKGFVCDDAGGVFAVQSVSRRWSVEAAAADSPLGLVCIGLKPSFDAAAVRNAVSALAPAHEVATQRG